MESLNVDLVTNALNFHGQQFQKIWEGERGEQDFSKVSFDLHTRRSKHLAFQDRAKRLKLQQFIAKKADLLFSKDTLERTSLPEETAVTEDMYAVMPSLETYMNVDKQSRMKYFRENVKVGNLILGTIMSKTQSGMMLKVLCTTGAGLPVHYFADINLKAFCPVANIIPAVDRKGVSRSYMMNDSVCCEVLEVIADTDRIMCGMKGTTREPTDPEHRPALGLISADDFPLAYKKALEHKNETYDTVLEKSVGFNNPNNISHLSAQLGVDDPHCSNISMLRARFPESEYADELRQQQASKWAYSNVADGIDHFKAGRHTEAFQCLNKALNIDPKNVEGLVARGALYANSGNFQKAIEDFETALKLNPNHANARKYMGETLVALGRSYEEDNKFDDAKKAYQSCLTIIPFHEEAQNSLEFLKTKVQPPKNLIEPGELLLPNLSANKNVGVNDALKQLLKGEDDDKKDKKKKKKSKKRKSRRRSSSTSSSSSSGSNDSSSSSSSSSSDSSSSSGDSDFKKRKKHRSRSRREKQSSLSPLSKRMAMMDPAHDTPTNYQFNKPATAATLEFSLERPKSENESYEAKLRNFLEQTKGDTDYEDKVRKFLEESAKWKKDKKDDKKKKKKKDKKSKKESKKKRKDKKIKRKLDEYELRDALKKELGIKDTKRSSKKHGLNSDDEEYLLQKVGGYSNKRLLDNYPDLDELENKLKAYYALEKEAKSFVRSNSDMSESPKRSMGSPSPTREQKARQAVAEAAASASTSGAPQKWKMQIGASTSTSRFKRKQDKDDWMDDPLHDLHNKNGEHSLQEILKKPPPPLPPMPQDKNMSVRKVMSMKEMPMKKIEPELPKKKPPPPKNPIPQGQVVLDKFGNFRLVTPPKIPPLPPGAPPKGYDGRGKPPEPPGRPRSDSRSPRRTRSHSRNKYSRSRSSSGSRSRSRSYRSRSRSYYSRSRSRSGSYYSRSRSRSRSYSGDRRRHRRGGFRGRFNDRGTYYKPRFQNPRNNYQRGGRGGGNNYYGRDRYNDRDYRGGRGGGRFFNNRGRRPRGRFQRGGGGGGYRDHRDRRYDRSRSRDRSRSYSGSRERDTSPADREPIKKHEDKEKTNKYLDNEVEQPIRHEGPLSEGEDRDDYTNEKYVDREAYDGKWADKGEAGGPSGSGEKSASIPSETNIEEMDKFLTKVKKDKKEEMLERNKDIIKPKA